MKKQLSDILFQQVKEKLASIEKLAENDEYNDAEEHAVELLELIQSIAKIDEILE